MPDLWTHYFFAQDVKKETKLRIHRKDAYFLGAQGPDFLFYLDFLPWKSRKNNKHLGTLLHKDATPGVLEHAYEAIDKGDEILQSYGYGFLAHYALDSSVHPFIYYHTKTDEEHKKLESSIDVAIFGIRKGRNIRKQNTVRLIDVGDHLPKEIEGFYKKMAKNLFNIEFDDDQINESYRDFKKYLKLTKGSNALKVKILQGISSMVKEPFAHHIYPTHVDPNILSQEMFKEFAKLYQRGKLRYRELLVKRSFQNLRNFDGNLYE